MLEKLIHSVGEPRWKVGVLQAFSGAPVTPDHIKSQWTNKETGWGFDGKVLHNKSYVSSASWPQLRNTCNFPQ